MTRKINLSKVKSYSALLMGTFVLLTATFSSIRVYKKITSETQKNFYKTSENTLDGYHKNINLSQTASKSAPNFD